MVLGIGNWSSCERQVNGSPCYWQYLCSQITTHYYTIISLYYSAQNAIYPRSYPVLRPTYSLIKLFKAPGGLDRYIALGYWLDWPPTDKREQIICMKYQHFEAGASSSWPIAPLRCEWYGTI